MADKVKLHFKYDIPGRRRRLIVLGRDVPFWLPDFEGFPRPALGVGYATTTTLDVSSGSSVTILTSDNPQTIINNNPNNGQLFTFEAGTHSINPALTPSADNQIFQGETDGTPVSVTALDPLGVSLGQTKEMWSSGTPTSIMDGPDPTTTTGFMVDHTSPISWTGIVIRKLKLQNFIQAGDNPGGIVGGRYTQDWIVEDCWLIGAFRTIKMGESMIVRRNRIEQSRVAWLAASVGVGGTQANPSIVEDNEVFDVNIGEESHATETVAGSPSWDAGFKISGGGEWYIIRRNYIRDCHGPGVWFDGRGDNEEISDNIIVDAGLHDDGGIVPHIFYEINWSHAGMPIRNNWCLGRGASINVSHSHGDGTDYIEVKENTVDCDSGDRQGLVIKDTNAGRTGGDSTLSPDHPVINTVGLGTGKHFCDRIRFSDNVMRKRNNSFGGPVPIAGMNQGGGDHERNYEYVDNKYEIHTDIANPFRWDDAAINFAAWQGKRAATGDVQNTGPFFDVNGSFVTWSGTKQFADTPNNWENV